MTDDFVVARQRTEHDLTELENVDLAAATVQLKMEEVGYHAVLGATSRVIQPSLLDFLR